MKKPMRTKANTKDGRMSITAANLTAENIPANLSAIVLEMKKAHKPLRFGWHPRKQSVYNWMRGEGFYDPAEAIEHIEAENGVVRVYKEHLGGTANTRGCIYVSVVVFE